ncbi:LuxR family transcriptional regulator [Aeromonas sp. R7-3]|uniref:LuxR family transcriptional regulator n=1 Tax=Aeromonas sp. R7-3 TaxID=3138475 RepID=UPI0034A3DF6A
MPTLFENLLTLKEARHPDELAARIERIVTGLGFDYYRMAVIIPLSHQRPVIRIFNSCPSEWIDRYNRLNLIAIDPVVAAAQRQLTPIRWDALRASDEAMMVMSDAAAFGLRAGVSYPLHGPDGERGVLSFITEAPRPGLYIERAAELAMVVPFVLEAVLRLCRPTSQRALSGAEAECLRWVSEGKCSEAIGVIMGMPERTVNYHLQRACRKLGAATRSQAVARAMQAGDVPITLGESRVIDYGRG